MVRTLDRMVRHGLVERHPDATDGRISRIYLTERGQAPRDELIPRAVEVNDRTLRRLTAAEARALRRLLEMLGAWD